MNSLSRRVFTMIWQKIKYLFRDLTTNSLFFREFSIILLWIHYLLANSPWFDYEFTIFLPIHLNLTMNPLSFCEFSLIWLWYYFLFVNSLWFDYEFTIFWRIHYDLTMNSLSFREFTLIWQWIQYLFANSLWFDNDITFFSWIFMIWQWIHHLLANSLWFDYESTIDNATSLWIYCVFRDWTMNPLSLRIHYESTMNSF